jgi:hypothetical protein
VSRTVLSAKFKPWPNTEFTSQGSWNLRTCLSPCRWRVFCANRITYRVDLSW